MAYKDRYCSNGIQVEYEYFPIEEHFFVRIYRFPAILPNIIRGDWIPISEEEAKGEIAEITRKYPKTGEYHHETISDDERDARDDQFIASFVEMTC